MTFSKARRLGKRGRGEGGGWGGVGGGEVLRVLQFIPVLRRLMISDNEINAEVNAI